MNNIIVTPIFHKPPSTLWFYYTMHHDAWLLAILESMKLTCHKINIAWCNFTQNFTQDLLLYTHLQSDNNKTCLPTIKIHMSEKCPICFQHLISSLPWNILLNMSKKPGWQMDQRTDIWAQRQSENIMPPLLSGRGAMIGYKLFMQCTHSKEGWVLLGVWNWEGK